MSEPVRCKRCRRPVIFRWLRPGKRIAVELDVDRDRGRVLVDEAGRAHLFGTNAEAIAHLFARGDLEGPYVPHHLDACPGRTR